MSPVATLALAGILLLGLSVWVGLALMAIGVIGLEVFKDLAVQKFLGQDIFTSLTSPELAALPLFILMGDILFHTRLAEQLFRGLSPWTTRLPGSLLHVNILGCAIFAAASGSSAATAATIGKITLPELARRGYNRDLAMGSLAGAAVLGLLIPPSLVLIVYGVLTKVSVLQLFTAGIVPGILLAASFSAYLAIRATMSPEKAPKHTSTLSLGQRLRASANLLPIVGLITLVIGSMYAGIATPSEAAVMGVISALIIAALQRVLTPTMLARALMSAVRTSAMIGLILAGALFLSKAMAFLGVPNQIAAYIGEMGLGPVGIILVLLVFYIVLGCFLDGTSMMVMTLPVTFPLITAAGFDPIWFGIFLVLVAEMGAVTPPVGFNLFVVQDLTGEKFSRVGWATMPFFVIMILFAIFITVFPGVVLWLPGAN